MIRNREELVEQLVGELRPVRHAGRAEGRATLWLFGSLVFVSTAVLATDPFRPGFVAQLLAAPRFAIEMLLGIGAVVSLAVTGIRLGIPDPLSAARRAAPSFLLWLAWASAFVYGLWDPALELSMAGKREQCWLQTFVFAVPPMVVGLLVLRSLAVFQRAWAGAVLGAAAGTIPGVIMQIACMYLPAHILEAHVAPVFATTLLGALLGPLLLKRI